MWHFDDNVKVVITTGVPASGKSTFAESLVGFTELNLDNIREELTGDHTNQLVTMEAVALRNDRLRKLVISGERMIISDTNLNPIFRDQLVEMLVSKGVSKENIAIAHFEISEEEAARRNSLRSKPVPEDVMAYFFRTVKADPPSAWAAELGLPYFEFRGE